jgi:hypothetical protein
MDATSVDALVLGLSAFALSTRVAINATTLHRSARVHLDRGSHLVEPDGCSIQIWGYSMVLCPGWCKNISLALSALAPHL